MFLDSARYFGSLDGGYNVPPKTAPKKKNILYKKLFKRVFDVMFVMVAIPVVLPVVVIFAILIATDGKNPFYSQLRVGRNGKSFRMWKLRSMVPDADSHLLTYLAENPMAKAEWRLTQKLKMDPRITPVGRLIRKTSMDELPQLINILLGEMSVVGPRPMMPDQQVLYPGVDYYKMRPGLTGAWQVSARNESAFADRAPLDSQYYVDQSLKADIHIIMKTVGVVMRCTGY